MGMYTRLTFWADVKLNSESVPVLKYMTAIPHAPKPDAIPKHELFRCEHWEMLACGASAYHRTGRSSFIADSVADAWLLNIDSSLKNYDGEIKKFLNWLTPYDSGYDEFRGFYLYEEDEHPTLIYRSGGSYQFRSVEGHR
jgi:hypothetical protein